MLHVRRGWNGAGPSISYSAVRSLVDAIQCPNGLGSFGTAGEAGYVAGISAGFYGNLANQYAQSGDVAAAKQIAAQSGGAVSVSDVKNTISYIDDTGDAIGAQSFEKITVQAAAVVATVGCVLAEPCGIGELLLGTAIAGAALSDAFLPAEYHLPPKTLPGFPGSLKVPAKGRRATWKLTDGKIAEWDYQHGKVEVYNPRGNQHLGEFDPETGEQTGPPEPGRKAQQ